MWVPAWGGEDAVAGGGEDDVAELLRCGSKTGQVDESTALLRWDAVVDGPNTSIRGTSGTQGPALAGVLVAKAAPVLGRGTSVDGPTTGASGEGHSPKGTCTSWGVNLA